MFLKSLKIATNEKIIREINFHAGLNLILDETISLVEKPFDSTKDKVQSGNDVGKTTVLGLIDFCLDGDAKDVYTDAENKKTENLLVKNFLIEKEVVITLELTKDINNPYEYIIKIERNFLSRKNIIRNINGVHRTQEEFSKEITNLIFPGQYGKKPTFKQLIAHNIRYHDLRLNHTLRLLDRYTKDEEYEALYLFMFGCNEYDSSSKLGIQTKIGIEETFKKRLEKEQTLQSYEIALSYIMDEINILNEKKNSFNINKDFQADLDKLDQVKQKINTISSQNSQLKLKREIVIDAQASLLNKRSDIDTAQLQKFYNTVAQTVGNLSKTFGELQNFHNSMLEEKSKFIGQGLPKLNEVINANNEVIHALIQQEALLTKEVTKKPSFAELENVIEELKLKSEKKAVFEEKISQIIQVDESLAVLKEQLELINDGIFSDEYFEHVKSQIAKFNKFFSYVSEHMYGQKFALKAEKKVTKSGKKVYDFTEFNALNFSSGKKQGEITSFDIAYTLFADQEGIPCLHFLLTDKKELMHDNQLVKIVELVDKHNIQFVTSILRDKLPPSLDPDNYTVLSLSQEDKLFRIENYNEI